MKRPSDLRNPRRKSGYNGVAYGHGASTVRPYFAQVVIQQRPQRNWFGPRRATALEAAQDYCDYVNGKIAVAAPALKTANHPKARRADIDPEAAALRTKRRARAKGAKGHVYLVQEKGHTRAVKVGHTYQDPPQARLNGLQTGNPRFLVMLAAKRGTEADETALHAKYIAHNILGEWFRPTKALLSEFGLTKEALST